MSQEKLDLAEAAIAAHGAWAPSDLVDQISTALLRGEEIEALRLDSVLQVVDDLLKSRLAPLPRSL